MAQQHSDSGEDLRNKGASDDGPRDPDIVKEISLEEFQPKGTLTLTILYFVLLVILWIFMYFVEFAGNGPSIM